MKRMYCSILSPECKSVSMEMSSAFMFLHPAFFITHIVVDENSLKKYTAKRRYASQIVPS